MARIRVELDEGGMAELLKSSGVARLVESTADAVADAARSAPEVTRNNLPVRTISGTSDRARAVVTITHPAGIGVQAKYGTLTRAVTAAGLSSRKAAKGWRRGG